MTRVFDLPDSLVKRAEELAREDGVSLDIWVTSALAQKIGAVETAEVFFRRRSAGAGKGLSSYLDFIPITLRYQGMSCRGLEVPARNSWLVGKRETDDRGSWSPRSGFSDLGNFRSRSWRERKAEGSSSHPSQNRDMGHPPVS